MVCEEPRKVVMGPLTLVGSDQFLWLGSVQQFVVLGYFGKFPLKMSIFFLSDQKNLFGSDQKVPRSKAGRPLIYCGSKVSSGRVRDHLYRKVNLYKYLNRILRISNKTTRFGTHHFFVRADIVLKLVVH